MGVQLVALNCPLCGGQINIETMKCENCNTSFVMINTDGDLVDNTTTAKTNNTKEQTSYWYSPADEAFFHSHIQNRQCRMTDLITCTAHCRENYACFFLNYPDIFFKCQKVALEELEKKYGPDGCAAIKTLKSYLPQDGETEADAVFRVLRPDIIFKGQVYKSSFTGRYESV